MVILMVGTIATGASFAQDFNNGPVRGAYILDQMGQIYANGDVGSATYLGEFFGMPAAIDIEITPPGNGLWLLDVYGGLHTPQGAGNGTGGNDAIKMFTDPTPQDETDVRFAPYFGDSVAVDMEVTPQSFVTPGDNTTWGLFILDQFGGVHAVGSAASVQINDITAAPYFGYDIARDLELTSTGGGYFILDGLGAVHAVGDAVDQIPSPRGYPIPYFGFDIAKDLELVINTPMTATPETGWYMLDGIGGLHTMGLPAVRTGSPPDDNVFLTEGMDNVYFFFDIARDFEIMHDDPAVMGDETYFQLDGSGGIHPKQDYPFALEDGNGDPLHYFLGMDIAVDMEFLREPTMGG